MGALSCVSVVVIHQGCCDLSLGELENITVFIFNDRCLGFLHLGLWFYCASTKIGKLELFSLYLFINAGTKTSRRGLCLDRVCRSDNMRAILNYNEKPKGKDTGNSDKWPRLVVYSIYWQFYVFHVASR